MAFNSGGREAVANGGVGSSFKIGLESIARGGNDAADTGGNTGFSTASAFRWTAGGTGFGVEVRSISEDFVTAGDSICDEAGNDTNDTWYDDNGRSTLAGNRNPATSRSSAR
jgi:hypothetical protein